MLQWKLMIDIKGVRSGLKPGLAIHILLHDPAKPSS
jgi:hypothetical protein